MDDYISRQVAIDVLEKSRFPGVPYIDTGIQIALREIKAIPAADVAPVVHGRWLPIVSYNNTYKCSECGRLLVNITDGLSMVAKHYPYCHCGAKMEEDNG